MRWILHRRRTLVLLSLWSLAGCQTLSNRDPSSAEYGNNAYWPGDEVANNSAYSDLSPQQKDQLARHGLLTSEASRWDITHSPPVKDPATVPNAWERMRLGYRLEVPDNPRVQQEIDWYLNHPDYLDRVQQRARLYLHFILTEIEEKDIPTEIALLPVVESAFHPFAYSPAQAAGLWQFIPSTGKLYGLKQNWWYDGRRDIVESTRAALDFLVELKDMFDGDWELALASYNAGPGTVTRAVERNRQQGKPTDFWSLDLPQETKCYVPRLLAIAKLMESPEQYGLNVPPIPNSPYFAEVEVGGQLDLKVAANLAGMSLDELHKLNPGFNRRAMDPEGPHRLHLPIQTIGGFQSALARLDTNQRMPWQRYQVRRGEDLERLARRYNVDEDLLRQVNRMQTDKPRQGSYILVPDVEPTVAPETDSEAPTLVAAAAPAPAHEHQIHHDSAVVKAREVVRSSGYSAKAIAAKLNKSYVVRKGETLWSVARKFDVNPRELARWNGKPANVSLRAGDNLILAEREASPSLPPALPQKPLSKKEPGPTNIKGAPAAKLAAHTPPAPPAKPTAAAKPAPKALAMNYQVQKGETLTGIARKFNVSVDDIKRWNEIKNKDIRPGQRLTLNLDGARLASNRSL